MTIRNLTVPSFRGAVLNPSIVSAQFQHMSHELIQLIDPALAVNPSERPSMQQLLRGMIGLYGRQLKFEKTSSAAVAPAAAAPVSGAPSATEALAVGAIAALPGDVPPTLAVAKEDAAPKETARVRRLPPGLFGDVGSVGGGGGDCGAEDGGTASGGIFPTPAVATADTAPYGTATVQRLPPGLLVADSGGASLPAPNPAATAAAITTTTASAATVITATATVIVDRGDGAVSYPRSEGNTTTPAVTSGAIGDTGKGAAGSYDASGGGNGGGAHADGYAVQGSAPEPAMERVTKGSTARINAVDGGTAASETATGHFGFPRHAPTPHVKVPPSPTPLVRRQADGFPQVVHAGSSTPFREERSSDGSDTCGNTFGGGDGDGDEGEKYGEGQAEGGHLAAPASQEMGDGGKKEGVMETEDDGVSEKDQHAVEEERRLPDLAPPVKGGGEEEETAEEGNGSEERRHLGVLVAQEMGVGEWKAETAVGKKEVYGTEDKGRPTVLASREQPLSLPTAAVTTSTTITTTKRLRPTEMPRTQLGMPRHGHQLQARTISRSGRRRTRGKTSSRSGDNSRHHQQAAFRDTGASRRPAHQGDMAPAPSVARACPRVAAGGGGNFRGSDGGDGVSVTDNGWRGDARSLPAAPSAARQVACTNSGWRGPDVHSQLPVAACGSFATQATTVGAAVYYPRHAGRESVVGGNGAGRGRVAGWVGVEFDGGE
eukprot:jgi/Undpi1/4123/HiC_scaffold_16.g07490.m1